MYTIPTPFFCKFRIISNSWAISVSDNAAGISKADVKGKDIKEAVGAIVDKMVKNGEITNENNIVLISVEAIKQKAAEGEKEVADEVDEEMTDAQKAAIERTAQAILHVRALYPDCSLADLYDEVTMPVELRRAHQANDKAVMQAYGFWGKLNTESDCVAALRKMYAEMTKS